MPESEIVAVVPFVETETDPIDGAMTGAGGSPIRKETDFAADVLFLSVVIVTAQVYSPSARPEIVNCADAPVWPVSAATDAALLSE